MKLLVLETIMEGLGAALASGKEQPYVCHLPPRRAERLKKELASMGCHFAIPIGTDVPDPREGDDWTYLGIVLDVVHVFARSSR